MSVRHAAASALELAISKLPSGYLQCFVMVACICLRFQPVHLECPEVSRAAVRTSVRMWLRMMCLTMSPKLPALSA